MPAEEARWTLDMVRALPDDGNRYEVLDGVLLVSFPEAGRSPRRARRRVVVRRLLEIDHGMGLQSLYAHLSSIGVQRGDSVQVNQELGRSGTTGLAGGDHLHFTMLLGGRAVTPIDWWSAQWVEERITRKLREAGAG